MEQIEEYIDDDEIEYLTEAEIATAMAVSNFASIYYVYFNTSGDILCITNEKDINKTDSFLEIEYSRVEKFLSGNELIKNYKIVLSDDTTHALVKKTQELSYITNIFQIIDAPTSTALLVVTWDKIMKQWVFKIDTEYKKQLKSLGLSSRLLFFVTLDSNINFLIRSIEIDLKELVGTSSIAIPFVSDAETSIESITLSTRRFFDSYGLLLNE